MISPSINQTYQYLGWFMALIELILGMYVLALNSWHTSNRHVGFLLLLTSASTLILGSMERISEPSGLSLPLILMAIVTPAIQPWILIVSVVLLKPAWLRSRWKLAWQTVYGLTFLPALLTLIDVFLKTRLWYTGLEAGSNLNGFIHLADYTRGILGIPLRILSISLVPVLTLIPLGYVSFFDRRATPLTRQLARLLLAGQISAIAIQFGLRNVLPALAVLLSSFVFSAVYAVAAFRQLISERRFQRGSLQVRITVLILVISLPIIFAVGGFVSDRASNLILSDANAKLLALSQATRTDIDLWLLMNTRTLEQLASSPEIRSLEPAQQKPILEEMVAIYPYMNLVSTTGMDGINLARSDNEAPKDYSPQKWFQNIRKGDPLAFETVIDLTSGKPDLIVSKPIYNGQGKLAGVVMFASDLSTLASQITTTRVGTTGYVMVVDDQNKAVFHPDPTFISELKNIGDYPPVAAIRQGKRGAYLFTDSAGLRWRAYLSVSELNNDWTVIVQQSEAELLAPLRQFQGLAWLALAFGAVLLMATSWFSIRQAIQPIGALTATANAIAGGDLNRAAPVVSNDEIGSLAKAFNSMTDQLRELIANLEQRIDQRTADLERSTVQMQTAAQVAREAAAIRDLKQLLNQTTQLISDQFGFYHVGIFLIDETREYAVLQASNSQGGQRMLARRHKLQIGKVGIVGYVASAAKPRTALNVGEDSAFFNNPDLPLTRSEMALPMKAREQVIGVLDVQSTKLGAFTEKDIEILQILADQIALAIENARLLDESQRTLIELEVQYGEYTRQAWNGQQRGKLQGYIFNRIGVEPVPISQLENLPVSSSLESEREEFLAAGSRQINVPIIIRNQALGSVILRRDEDQEPWTNEDRTLVMEAVNQIAQALENARLFEESRHRALQERLIGDVAAKAQRSLDLDTLMKTAVREIGLVTSAARVQIRLGSQGTRNGPAENGGSEPEG